MKGLKLLSLMLLTTLILAACGSNKERTHINIAYLQENAIENLDEYLKDDNTNSTNEKIVEESKKEFIRWTATVQKINTDTKITLQEDGLPLIVVKLKEKISEDVKVGDIITVSGTLDKYEYGLFTITPKWRMEKGLIVETSEEDKQNVLDYQKAYSDAVAVKTKEEAEAQEEIQAEIEANRKADAAAEKEYYVAEVVPQIEDVISVYDNIWSELWQPTFEGLSNGSVDVYSAFETMNTVELGYSALDTQISNINGDKLSKENKKLLSEVKSNLRDAAQSRRSSAKEAKKAIDKGIFSPSEIEKIKKNIDYADGSMIHAVLSKTKIDSDFGLLVEEK